MLDLLFPWCAQASRRIPLKEKRAFHGVADLQQQNEGGSPGLVVEEEAHNKEVVCSNPTRCYIKMFSLLQ